MNFYKLCDYFEDIGIINLETITTFLNIYTRLQKSSKAIIPNNAMRAKYALYNFIKHISANNTLLLDYSKQIIEKYSNYTALQQQLNLRRLVRIIQFKLKLSAIASFYKLENLQKMNNYRYQNSSPIQNSIELNKTISSKSDHNKRSKLYSKKGNSYSKDNIGKKNQIERKINFRNNNRGLMPNKKYKKSLTNSLCQYSFPINNCKDNNNKTLPIRSNSLKEDNINTKDNNNKLHSNRNHTSLDQFHSSQAQYISDHNDKLHALQIEKQKQMESLFTFQPKINHQQYPYRKTQSLAIDSRNKIPIYLKLNQDAIKHKNKMHQLQRKLKEEKESELRSHSYKNNFNDNNESDMPNEFYYEKLYQDAYDYKKRKSSKEKKYFANLTFQPNNELSHCINRKLEIKSTFDERNQRSIENKRGYQSLKEIEEKEIEIKRKKERLPREKIEENNKSVIDRLYIAHFEKKREKENRSNAKSLSSSSLNSNNNNPHYHYHKNNKVNTLSIVSSDNTTTLLSEKNRNEQNNNEIMQRDHNSIESDPSLPHSKVLNDIITNIDPGIQKR